MKTSDLKNAISQHTGRKPPKSNDVRYLTRKLAMLERRASQGILRNPKAPAAAPAFTPPTAPATPTVARFEDISLAQAAKRLGMILVREADGTEIGVGTMGADGTLTLMPLPPGMLGGR